MKILVVGGTGFAGGYTANFLKKQGHDVTIMGRSKPANASMLGDLKFVAGNYIEESFDDGRLEGYDWMVFAAGNDITKMPFDGSVTPEEFFQRSNSEAIPRFFKYAKAAGIKRVAYLGTFYPQVAPQQIDVNPYVKSRYIADEAIREMSSPDFNVCSLNAPFILGQIPGFDVAHITAMAHYAKGNLTDLPVFAPKGGTNHITVHSVAQAIQGGLERGESGKAYLIGDANLSWKEYMEEWFSLAGNEQEIEVREDDHPLLPNIIMYAGVGATVSYEPPAEETELLGYDRGVLKSMISEVIKSVG
ncbi:epimerase [Endozoicomonas sp. OPT23]|uniref:NAD-dependent epimerase/dehydratase family protein n=1 Tax=Endozoicomonas sp. OPT23 TaxID=2072845 RepID=UPI00129B1CCE|nr:NAD-dependent epimerase/dehydratase family protein [Endozoicomonas sp. OPT23]MRI32773.1 epimerase [Endozoicomonas sp. OPT23]